jgi:peroxiredoxin Q/BCP
MMIAVGDTAPDFTLADQNGEPVTLSDLRGKPVVIYFYPKADTTCYYPQYGGSS